MHHPGQPVSARRAGQGSAGAGPALGGQVPEFLTQHGRSGDDDRGQHSAGGLAGLDGIVPVDHQQPQRFPVTISPHLPRPGAGQQFPCRADGVDRVALACPPLAHMPGGIDLRDVLACGGQVPGQAQAVVTGALDRPRQLRARGRGTGPGQQLPVAVRRRRDLQL